ncbi:hypothetical protein K1T71_001485 [Dendrolimus kikuchii]|uniref:Uncharacterized protein n=1 Tax=Dendrolimus kikuchii TaxID=765133 RepID=A0ACC1DHR7_9NEOP|nr:hypothetical protein K1T71_001485 [Dendrolimus kikuchii]
MSRFLGLVDYIGDKDVVCHGDDLGYLFASRIVESMNSELDINSETFKMIDAVTKLWVNFAKYGNPTPDSSFGVVWSPYTLEDQAYLNIGKELDTKNIPDKEEKLFWESLFKQYSPRWTV